MRKMVDRNLILVAIVPLTILILWTQIVKINPMIFYRSIHYHIGIIFLITVIPAFIVNLISPAAYSNRRAVAIALPTAIMFVFINSVLPFIYGIDPNDWLEDVGFQYFWSCLIFPPLGLVLCLFISCASRLGSYFHERIVAIMV